jgi:hypothetical protein
MNDSPWLPRVLQPAFLGALTVWYAIIHLISGLVLIVMYPSTSFMETIGALRSTFSSALMIAAIGALTMAVSRNTYLLWNHVIPEMRRPS